MLTRFLGEFRKGLFHPRHWLRTIFVGLILGVYQVFLSISLVNLIFSGPLADALPYGIGLVLISAGVVSISLALFSTVPGVLANIQESPAILLALITSSLVSAVTARSPGSTSQLFATVLVTLAFSTVLTGAALFLLGRFRLGGLSRYIPYPVVGGFLAGTGWLLILGTIQLQTGLKVNGSSLASLFSTSMLVRWVPSLLLGVILFYALRWIRHPLLMPSILVGSIFLFYLVLALAGVALEQAVEMGLLFGEDLHARWQPLTLNILSEADWLAVLAQTGNILILAAITLVGFLLRISAIEISTKNEFEINNELTVTGSTIFLTGLLGGMIGHHGLGITRLGQNLGVRTRQVGLVVGFLCLGIFFLSGSLIGYFPLPVLGGLLFMLAYDFIYQWIITGWRRFTWMEFAVILIILLTIALSGFLTGVAVGLIAMVILFVISYSQINVIHHEFSGSEVRSNVERSIEQRRLLTEFGQQIYVLELQGFLFFGTANTLYEHIKQKINRENNLPVVFIVLDFRLVSGLDSSVVLSFLKLEQMVRLRGITMVLAHTDLVIQDRLTRGGIDLSSASFQLFPDLDHGLEWCENQVLVWAGLSQAISSRDMVSSLVSDGVDTGTAQQLLPYFEQVTVQTGETLIQQGDPAEDLFFILDGQVSIYLEFAGSDRQHHSRMRLSTLNSGTIVGEMGFYMGSSRSASVIADKPTNAFRLDKAGLEKMEQHDPRLASAFHALISRQLSERLLQANRGLQALRSSTRH